MTGWLVEKELGIDLGGGLATRVRYQPIGATGGDWREVPMGVRQAHCGVLFGWIDMERARRGSRPLWSG